MCIDIKIMHNRAQQSTHTERGQQCICVCAYMYVCVRFGNLDNDKPASLPLQQDTFQLTGLGNLGHFQSQMWESSR